MVKVITYGTYDLLHYGHVRLLERAKALGDYLVVGVTSDDFDMSRGKINVQQSLMERIEAVKKTGLADEIIVEEYPGQKIDDIIRLGIDIFTVGSDWKGKFDYLNEFCRVVYLDRTEGVSSTELRTKNRALRLGMYGDETLFEFEKYKTESQYVNGAELVGICKENTDKESNLQNNDTSGADKKIYDSYEELLEDCDAVYIETNPENRYDQVKKALEKGKHVLCKMPVTLSKRETMELIDAAKKKNLVLMGAIKTAYSVAYNRLILLAKSGHIGKVVHADVTCTRIDDDTIDNTKMPNEWNGLCTWGPFAMLPVFQLMGIDYEEVDIKTYPFREKKGIDAFTKIDFTYKDKTATIKVGKGVKAESEMIISGTQGYIYVPAPWWKTDYFEIRYERLENKKKYFYQLDGEGIRFEIAAFIKSIQTGRTGNYINNSIMEHISKIVESYYKGEGVKYMDPI